jgi:hypothetical protein
MKLIYSNSIVVKHSTKALHQFCESNFNLFVIAGTISLTVDIYEVFITNNLQA